MRAHQMVTADGGDYVDCIVCGAKYPMDENGDHDAPADCSGRTDLVHGNDDNSTSHHSLDGCEDYDFDGTCDHLAVTHGCECASCA